MDAPAVEVKQRRKTRSGATAMKHARAVFDHEGWVCQYAGKRVVRLGDGRMFTAAEDLFGVFDAIAIAPNLTPRFVQVTSEHESRSSTSDRKRKIETWLRETVGASPSRPLLVQVELWAWVDRRHFRRFVWLYSSSEWHEVAPLGSPLLAPRRAA